jgi:transcriptional regulator with XRE-family HTH domain
MNAENSFQISNDIKLIREMLNLSQSDLARELHVNRSTINRWESGQISSESVNYESFYNFAYTNGVKLNQIKEQFYKEELVKNTEHLLFHGAKERIVGNIRWDASRSNNDFGKGFYCGESLMQSALFVANFPSSCIYMVSFDTDVLKGVKYRVDVDWMLTIAYFRGKLERYKDDERVKKLRAKAESADYIVAPIADNRMYEVIADYIDGEITDEQCRHSLAATDLGFQYIIKSQQAADRVVIKEQCYLCEEEKRNYQLLRESNQKDSADKVKAARIQYRGKGQYIDEVFEK